MAVKVLPPGIWVYDWISDIQKIEHASLVNSVINGVVYGIVIWVAFSLVKMAWERKKRKKQQAKPGS